MPAEASAPGRRHPALQPYRHLLDALGSAPALAALNACAQARARAGAPGRALRFVPAGAKRMRALDYERCIVERGEIPTRAGSAHDAWNALAWLAFPRTKLALSMLHVAHGAVPAGVRAQPGRRGRVRDAATLLDESGALVLCADPALVHLWRAREWRALFRDRREDVERSMRIAVVGHAVLERLGHPFPALTLRALVMEGEILDARDPAAVADVLDAAAGAWLADNGDGFASRELLPLPVAAWPGWDRDSRGPERFDDPAVYRPLRHRSTRSASDSAPH